MSTRTRNPMAQPASASGGGRGGGRKKKPWKHLAAIVILSIWTVFALAPIVWITMMSFKEPGDIIASTLR